MIYCYLFTARRYIGVRRWNLRLDRERHIHTAQQSLNRRALRSGVFIPSCWLVCFRYRILRLCGSSQREHQLTFGRKFAFSSSLLTVYLIFLNMDFKGVTNYSNLTYTYTIKIYTTIYHSYNFRFSKFLNFININSMVLLRLKYK